ncbi:MAG: tetratricopeptide repeat protein, partial [Flavobacteriales bacterium]
MRTVTLLALPLLSFGAHAQLLSFDEWLSRADKDPYLQPRFGDAGPEVVNNTVDQDVFVAITNNRNRQRAMSDSLCRLGFERLRKNDHVGAMRRFNEAWLAMPINPEAHRGFGAFFRSMKRPLEAHEHYRAGIAADSTYAPLLKEEADVYMEQRYHMQQEGRDKQAHDYTLKALDLYKRAHRRMGADPEVTYRLFECYVYVMNCP